MTSFAIASPTVVTTSSPSPVGPPGTGPVGAPPTAVPPTGVPATPPTRTPLGTVSATLVTDLTEASRLVGKAVELLGTVPLDDVGSDATKDLRIRVFKTNTAAQSRIEKQLAAGNPDAVVSELRRADGYLEDANWQLAKKPSPDGRFTGVDVPGAVRDTAEGARILNELLAAAGGSPSTPSTPPPAPPSRPDGPPAPPTTPDAPPSVPPAAPPTVPPTTTPGTGTPDADYPGEDEFPTDDKILNGSAGDT